MRARLAGVRLSKEVPAKGELVGIRAFVINVLCSPTAIDGMATKLVAVLEVTSARLPLVESAEDDKLKDAVDELAICAADCSASASGSTASDGAIGVSSNAAWSTAISEFVEATTSKPFGPRPRPRKTISVKAKITTK
ncbi:MAG: hypothetical protein NTW52_18075 [Planctomycetota bacterium]|nr:hypothetical protein [Planctomycetota bacterium]